MSRIISYTPDENLRRIIMQKRTKFIVVEGEDDVPIYESALHHALLEKGGDVDFIVVHGGGKGTINKFVENYNGENFKVVMDMDFDHNDKLKDERITYTSGYSVENYYFNKRVLSYLISNILKKNMRDVYTWFNIDDWCNHVNEKCLLCLKYIFYYQKEYDSDKSKWSNIFLTKDRCWKIDEEKIMKFIDDIKRQIDVDDEVVLAYFDRNFPRYDCLTRVFPGKIIFVSIYRYIKDFLETDHSGVFGANFTNDKALKNSATAYLKFNLEFRGLVMPLTKFVMDEPVMAS